VLVGALFIGVLLGSNLHISFANTPSVSDPGITQPIAPAQPAQQTQQQPIQQQSQSQPQQPVASSNMCPSTDFSLEHTSCNYAGGKLLICEGDMNFPTFGFHHDSDPTTGQVFEIDQAGTIDGTDNGGSCHYSPPWTLEQSISSVKGGCGNGCASVLVYRDGQPVTP
jgi:hypothetical protein